MKKSVLGLLFLSLVLAAAGQSKHKNPCYRETIGNSAATLTEASSLPKYKHGNRELSMILSGSMDLEKIYASLPDYPSMEDSVKVKFVISRNAEMSDISVSSKWSVLTSEIKNALIRTSCSWQPGATESPVSAWYHGIVYVKLERKTNSIRLSVFD
ncbi:hypothetical protein [Flavihumibacter petaseus]|uniref:TonB C-terminal domain-containing protein n=1 Tax=Flavihumibacter petaseus NBRC 106054 TaxID=1220578 RepID=A0A0E9N045_9BACT|nr:hypothetical protein [Flavihumibacter petaseus]GAO42740.1 hypothetical protein FPE01S_01_17580 [Flavihumibacter petaseus NBRC 106054]